MKRRTNKIILKIIAEVGIIIAAANLLFYLNKNFQSSLSNLLIAIIMLIIAIWLKVYEDE